jgi:hypothetical protein
VRFVAALFAFVAAFFARRRQRRIVQLAAKVRAIPAKLEEADAPRIKYQAALRHVLRAQGVKKRMTMSPAARKAERRAAR